MIDLESPDYFERTGSDTCVGLVELHVYVVPTDLWSVRLHSAVNQIVGETVSAGFIRVYPETQLCDIRNQITKQLEHEVVPKNYVFLRCIGRCFTQVKHKQERELKAKHFIPPIAQEPELFVLDMKLSTDNDDDELATLRSTDSFRGQREEEDEDDEGNRRLLDGDEERRSRLTDEEFDRRRWAKTTPPPLRESSEDEESRILRELERMKRRRRDMERQRDELMKKMKLLEAKQYSRINNAGRDAWKKKYFEEKKTTQPVEDQCSRLRQQVQSNHRKDIAHLESLRDSCQRTLGDETYEQIGMRIQALQYEHEIEDVQTKLQNVKMKITKEIRLRYQTECQLQALRAELAQRKLSLMFSRAEAYRARRARDPFVSTSRTLTEDSHLTPRSQLTYRN